MHVGPRWFADLAWREPVSLCGDLNVSSSADDDIHRDTGLACAVVACWGMADDVGPIDLRQSEKHPFLGREIAQPRQFSPETAAEIERLITELEANETLDRQQIETCLGAIGRGDAVRDAESISA